MSSLKTVTKNTFLYTVSPILQRASSIIFFPIFSYYLTKGDYGIQGIVGYLSTFITVIAGMELTRIASRMVYNGEEKELRIKKVYGTFMTAILTANIGLMIFLLFTGKFIFSSFLNDISFYPYMVFTLLSLPCVATYTLYKNYLQATHQGGRFVIIDLIYFVLNVGLNLYFVIAFKLGAAGILLSTVVSSLIISIYAYFTFFGRIFSFFSWKVLREGLIISFPLIPYVILATATDGTDKIVLNDKLGKDASGLLYIATTMSALFNVIREASYQALAPWFYEFYPKKEKAYINKLFYSIFAGMAIVVIGIAWFSHEILLTLSRNESLIEAYRYVPIIVNNGLVVFLSQVYSLNVYYHKKNLRYIVLTTLTAWPVNLILSLLLVGPMGIWGATIANLGAMIVLTFVTGILAHYSGFRSNHLYFILIIIASFALSSIAILPIGFYPLLSIKIGGILLLLAAYYLYMNNNYDIKSLINKKIGSFGQSKKNDG